MKKNAFPKRLRLVNNDEFRAVIGQRRRFGDGVLVLYISPNGREFSRLGVTVGKAAGVAVERNRFKRLVREVFRQNREQIPAGFDYVVIVPKIAKDLVYENVKESFLKLAKKIEY